MSLETPGRKLPPRLAAWLLARTIEAADRDTLLGDFEEFYNEIADKRGFAQARIWYWNQFRKSFLRLIFNTCYWSIVMIRNYLTVSHRNILKNRANSLINILGLALGMACCILIFFFIRDERDYDRFHKNIDRIYHLGANLYMGNMRMTAEAHTPLASVLPGQFPEIALAVRMTREDLIFKSGDRIFKEKGLAADPGFFEMFTFPLKQNAPRDVLKDPQTVVLSEGAALKYFGRGEDPVGKSISVQVSERPQDFRVAAVAEPFPDNSSLRFDFIVNIATIYGERLDNWGPGLNTTTFVQLKERALPQDLTKKFPDTIDTRWTKRFDKKSGYHLEAFADYHLKGQHELPVLEGQSKAVYSRILSGIALLILLIACFNFMNLSLGNASTRFKEIGMRKVLGAGRPNLIRQFCLEAVTLSLTALVLGVILARLFLPAFNSFAQKNFKLDFFGPGVPLLVLFVLAAAFGIVSGIYPALVLSGFDSVSLFRRRIRFTGKNAFSRVMIVLQFGISIFMIISTLVLDRQNRYMLTKNLGYDSAQVVIVPLTDIKSQTKKQVAFFPVFKQKLLQYGSIRSVAGSEWPLADRWSASGPKLKEGARKVVIQNGVDYDFIPAMGMTLLEGRNFSPDFPSDTTDSVVVNHAFIEQFSLASPLGQDVSTPFSDSQGLKGKIIGVVADFHFQSLHEKIHPTVLTLAPADDIEYASVKIDAEGMRETLKAIEKEFLGLAPEIPFAYTFLDDKVARQYEAEEQWGKIVTYASILAILIASAGLFGLTLITVARRTKEIGIRRVMGASVFHITRLINREFIALVLVANVIGWPAAYWGMKTLLRNYAYRIPVGLIFFVLAGVLAAAIALLTVSLLSVRISLSNPVETLRYE